MGLPAREVFDIPDDVTYLNAAYLGPLSRATVEAGTAGLARKAQPWGIVAADFFEPVAALRESLAALIGATPDGIALTPSASYGIASVVANLPLDPAGGALVLADQFPSNVYPWREAVRQADAELHTVQRPEDGGWGEAVVDAIDERVQIVAVPVCHWTDGTLVDLVAIRARCHEVGAALLVDGSQSFGAAPFDVSIVEPDFAVGVGYKWLLGPYSQAFLYVAPHHRSGSPIEHNWINRAASEDFAGLVSYRSEFQPGSRRFDVGEVSNFALVPATHAAVQQILAWGVPAIEAHARVLTDLGARRADELGLAVADAKQRSAHLMGVRLPPLDPRALAERLASERVFVSVRGDAVRISAHVFNSVDDIERLFAVLGAVAVADGVRASCAIVAGTDEAHVVLDDEIAIAFLDRRPLFPGHTLLIPRGHVETLVDLPTDLVEPLFLRAQRLARAMEVALDATGSFVAMNNRVSQSVAHLHVHVVPRRPRDGLRGFFWPRTRDASEGEAADVAARLRRHLDS